MFLGVVVLAMGLILILQALGLIGGNFWMLFWGVFFLVLGIKMVSKKHVCWHCEWFGHQHHKGDHKSE